MQVVAPPDPDLLEHLVSRGVVLDMGVPEADRINRAFTVQVRACGGITGCLLLTACYCLLLLPATACCCCLLLTACY